MKKRTKIVATISDRRCDPGFIRELYEAGMNVVRINTAHQPPEASVNVIKNVRQVSDKIAILIDTKGPEIRTTVCDEKVNLKKGEKISLIGDPGCKTSDKAIYVSHSKIADDVETGSTFLIDDGEIELTVTGRKGNILECLIENDGILGSRKSVNIPGSKICLPSLTDKDRAFIKMAIEQDIDFIAHSFVRNSQDVKEIGRAHV